MYRKLHVKLNCLLKYTCWCLMFSIFSLQGGLMKDSFHVIWHWLHEKNWKETLKNRVITAISNTSISNDFLHFPLWKVIFTPIYRPVVLIKTQSRQSNLLDESKNNKRWDSSGPDTATHTAICENNNNSFQNNNNKSPNFHLRQKSLDTTIGFSARPDKLALY